MRVWRSSDLSRLWDLLGRYLRPYWKQVLLSLLCYFVASLLTAAQPMVTAPILELAVKGSQALSQLGEGGAVQLADVNLNNLGQFVLHLMFPQPTGAWQAVLTIALLYLGISVALYVLNFLVYLLGIWIRVKAGRDMQANLFSHVTSLSLDFFSARRTGELISRLDKDTDAVVFGLESASRTLIVSSVLVLIYGALLLRTNLELSLFVAATAAVQYVFIQVVRRPMQKRVREQFNVQAAVTAYLQEVISNIRIVKSFAAEEFERQRIRNLAQKFSQAQFRFSFFKNVDEPVTFIINSVTNVVILLFATNQLLVGELSTTGFFLYLYVGRAVLEPVTSLARAIKGMQATVATSERVQELFGQTTSIQSGHLKKYRFERSIRFENVTFAYKEDKVIQDLNLEINRGQVTALVGHSGAGKSTITDLVLRFYDPLTGRITIDGEDLRHLDLKTYREMIGVVPQDSILFNASVAENIAYPQTKFDMRAVEQAARIANAEEFIHQLPQQYETLVGDRGVLLSGGQKQRVTIARAVYRQPQILILDEATSSLDTESERLVQKAIDRVIEGTTAIVIAHRLSTVINANKIVVMDAGRIVDQGKHQELLERCEIYQNLCRLQFETAPQALPTVN